MKLTPTACAVAFEPESALWRLLRDDPDRYIYPAVRHGVVDDKGNVIPLPETIAAGVSDVAKRDGWNRAATVPTRCPRRPGGSTWPGGNAVWRFERSSETARSTKSMT